MSAIDKVMPSPTRHTSNTLAFPKHHPFVLHNHIPTAYVFVHTRPSVVVFQLFEFDIHCLCARQHPQLRYHEVYNEAMELVELLR